MTSAELAAALFRTTLVTAAAACATALLLDKLRVASPRVHRIGWGLVILQGWLLWPWTYHIEVEPPRPLRAPIASRQFLSVAPQNVVVRELSPAPAPPGWTVDEAATAAIRVWLAGCLVVAFRFAWRYRRLARTIPLGSIPELSQWQDEWTEELAAANIRRRASFRMTDHLGPLVCYVPFCYLILAPRTLWSILASAERRAILRHELAHLRRGDLWTALAIRAAALPQWFNPLAWLAVRRFDEAAEWACDDAATGRSAAESLSLAQSLVRAAELVSTTLDPAPLAALPGSLSARGGRLSRRIRRLAMPRSMEESKMKKLLVPVLLVAVAAAQLVRVERVAATEDKAVPATSEKAKPHEAVSLAGAPATAAMPAGVGQATFPPPVTFASAKSLVASDDYVLEPPDSLIVEVTGGKPLSAVTGYVKGATVEVFAIVQPDGLVEIGPFGRKAQITGKTAAEAADAIERELAEVIEEPKVTIRLQQANSKVAYVIMQGFGPDPAADNVTRVQLPVSPAPPDTVESVLKRTSYPHPFDFADAIVFVLRSSKDGEERMRLLVDWKPGSATKSMKEPIQPGDRVFVQLPRKESTGDSTAYQAAPTFPPSTTLASGARRGGEVQGPQPGDAIFNITVVEDTSGSFQEFRTLRDQGFMVGDADSLSGTLAILVKNKLAHVLMTPKVVTAVDHPAAFAISQPNSEQINLYPKIEGAPAYTDVNPPEISFEVRPKPVGEKLRVAFRMEITRGDAGPGGTGTRRTIDIGHDLASGEAVVVRMESPRVESPTSTSVPKATENATYVIVSPTFTLPRPTPAVIYPSPAATYAAPTLLPEQAAYVSPSDPQPFGSTPEPTHILPSPENSPAR